MLKILRKKGVAKKILWFIAIVIIISFGFFGSASMFSNQGTITDAGSIFGKSVSFPAFQNAYRDVRINALLRHGDKFNEYIKLVNLNAETWDRLILLTEAKRRRLKVSDEELVRTIQQYPFFHRDGVFDNVLYQDVVRYVFNVPARSFEEGMRDSLLINKLFAQETFSATVLEEDIRQAFQKQNEKVKVSYIMISAEQFKNEASFNEEAARAYYEENKFQFTLPESINVEYIKIPFPSAAEQTSVAEGETETPSPKQQSEALAATVFAELKETPDLKAVAEKHKLEVKTSGFFSMEDPKLDMGMSFDLIRQLFDLPADVISQPVESSDAFFIVKIAERKEAAVPEYEEAKDKVKDALLTKEAMVIAGDKAKVVRENLKKQYESVLPRNFADAAKALGLELNQTPAFRRGQYLEGIGIAVPFQDAAFALSETDKISDVVQDAKGFYILHLDEYVAPDPQEYELQKEELAQFLLQQKRSEVFGEFLSELRLKANLTDNVSKLEQEQQSQPQ